MRSRALKAVLPESSAYAAAASGADSQCGVSAMTRPSQPMIGRVGRASSRHHVTSLVSPNVQIIAMPEPLSGSASGCGRTSTSTSKSGLRTVVPNSA